MVVPILIWDLKPDPLKLPILTIVCQRTIIETTDFIGHLPMSLSMNPADYLRIDLSLISIGVSVSMDINVTELINS